MPDRLESAPRLISSDVRATLPDFMALSAFNLGKLKIAGHVREELDRAGLTAQSIECRSGGLHMVPGTARLTVVLDGTASHLDFNTREVEDCEQIVAGETWYRITAFIKSLPAPP